MYEKLQKGRRIDDSDAYYDARDFAINLRDGFKTNIEDLRSEAAKQIQSNVPAEKIQVIPQKGKALSDTNEAVESDRTGSELMTVEEAANYLGISASTIYHWSSDGLIDPPRIGKQLRFTKEYIEYLLEKTANTKANSHKTEEKKHHFTFQGSLELFTNVFIEKGYLDKENAALMNDRFSKEPQSGEKIIEWKDDEYSLMAFIYFTDCLDLWGKEPSDIKLQPFYSPEHGDKEKGVRYSTLALENFNVCGSSHKWNKTTVSRARKTINEAFMNLSKQIINDGLHKDKEIDAECRRLSLKYYFERKNDNRPGTKFYDPTIKMLDIIGDVIKDNQNKFETFLKLSRSLLKK